MKNPFVQGLLRHVLTILAGSLATKGVIQPNETEIVVGVGLGVIGVIWSAIDKKLQAKKLRAVPVEQ